MSTVKISQLPNIPGGLNANTSNSLFLGVDIPTGITGKFTATQLAERLYANNVLNVGDNPVVFPNVVAQFAGDSEAYLQVNLLNSVANGSADYVATADTGTDTTYYVDLGINNSNYNISPLDGYLIVAGGGTSNPGGNLMLGSITSGKQIEFVLGGFEQANVVARMIDNTGFRLTKKPIIFADGTSQNTAAVAADYSQGSFAAANTAGANTVAINTLALAAYGKANAEGQINVTQNTNISSVNTYASMASFTANSGWTSANAGVALATAAYAQANNASSNTVYLQTINDLQNTNIASVNTFTQAAFSKANNALANTSGTFAGDLTITGNLIVSNTATINGTLISTLTANGNVSAYASKHLVEYNPTTKALTYSSTPDASSPYITGYSQEIHVSPVAFNDSGKGTIGDPVKTIAQAIQLISPAFETTAAGQRKTIVLHPGDYAENVTIDTQYTVLTTHELIGKSTTLSGTLTLTTGCTIDGLKMTNLVISGTSANGSVDIIGCTVTTSTTKTSSAYTNFRGCDLSSSTLSITGTGTVVMVGGNYFTTTVNNAAASVLTKAVVSMGPVTLTAGTMQIADTLVYAATNTSNAITQSAGSVLTLNNSQILIPDLSNVARNSFGGFYSILHSIYDKTNSTFGGTSLNAISYSQYINADNLNVQGNVTMNGTVVLANTNFAATEAAFTITGAGSSQTPTQAGTLMQLTSKANTPARVLIDSFGTSNTAYPVIAGRSARGTVNAPTATQNNDILLRIAGNSYGTTGYAPFGDARIDFVATENHSDTNRGSRIRFWNTPTGSNVVNEIASFNADSVYFTGVVEPEKGFIFTPRLPVGNQTAITIDFSSDVIIKANLAADLTFTLSNFVFGKVVEVWLTNTSGLTRTITHGCSSINSSENATTFTMPSTSSAYLRYFSIDGDLANTFVAIQHA